MKDARKMFEKKLYEIALRALKIRALLPDTLTDDDADVLKGCIDSCSEYLNKFLNIAFERDIDEITE